MPNRINKTDSGAVGAGAARGVERLGRVAPVGGPGAQAPSAPGDSVSITDAARRLASLQEAVANAPEINAGRVGEISTSIQRGQYKPDAAKIADRLIQLEEDLNSSGKNGKQQG